MNELTRLSIKEQHQRQFDSLGMFEEDPMSVAAAYAKVERFRETLAHMDSPLHEEVTRMRNDGRIVEGRIADEGDVLFTTVSTEGKRIGVSTQVRYLPRYQATMLTALRFMSVDDPWDIQDILTRGGE